MAEPASTQAHLLFRVIAQHYVARPALALPRKQGHLLFPCYSTALRCRASKFGCIPASPPRYSLHPLIQRSFLHIISRCSRYRVYRCVYPSCNGFFAVWYVQVCARIYPIALANLCSSCIGSFHVPKVRHLQLRDCCPHLTFFLSRQRRTLRRFPEPYPSSLQLRVHHTRLPLPPYFPRASKSLPITQNDCRVCYRM